jgi:hypothetical protein
MSENTVKEGTKIEADEAAKLDKDKFVTTKVDEPDVEGQVLYAAYVRCPWCLVVGRAVLSSNVYNHYTCGNCHRHFRA